MQWFMVSISNFDDWDLFKNKSFLGLGSFTGGKLPEFVVAKGSNLELLRADDNGKLATISSTPSFSIIRSIIPFRLAGINSFSLL